MVSGAVPVHIHQKEIDAIEVKILKTIEELHSLRIWNIIKFIRIWRKLSDLQRELRAQELVEYSNYDHRTTILL